MQTAEGNKEEAYRLWKKALSINGGIYYQKDNLIHSIIRYNIERGTLDNASKYVDQVIAIKDSIINVLRNDTIKDLQLRYDHEVEMNAANERMIRWQWVLGGLILLVLCLVSYILWKKHKTRLRQMEYDMQLSAFSHQTLELQMAITKAENQILELKSAECQNQAEIQRLEQVKEKARREMDEMEEKMRQWHDKEAEKIRKGVKLYDGIVKNEKAQTWTQEDYDAFIAFYEIGHYSTVRSFRREYTEITPRNMLYLILTDMGKTNEDISHILGIDLNSIRSIRHRLNTKKNED